MKFKKLELLEEFIQENAEKPEQGMEGSFSIYGSITKEGKIMLESCSLSMRKEMRKDIRPESKMKDVSPSTFGIALGQLKKKGKKEKEEEEEENG